MYCERLMSMPVITPEFYEKRLVEARKSASSGLHEAVWASNPEDYKRVYEESTVVCHRYMIAGMKVLDAGCGIGELTECLPDGVEYLGIDFCNGFIDVARERYPWHIFRVADLTDLAEYQDNSFDLSICRHVQGSCSDWVQAEKELLRASKKLLLIQAGNKPGDTIKSVTIKWSSDMGTIETNGSIYFQ